MFIEIFKSDALKIAHYGKFDVKCLLSDSIKVKKFVFDTMMAHYLLDEKGLHNLGLVARTYTDVGNYKDDVVDYMKGKIEIVEGDTKRN